MHRRAILGGLAALAALPAAAKEEPAAAGAGQKASFIRLPVVTANVIRSNRSRGVISVESGLDIPDPKLRARAPLFFPRLKADLARRLSLYTDRMKAGAAPDLEILAPMLQSQVDATLGQPGARLLILNVLIN